MACNAFAVCCSILLLTNNCSMSMTRVMPVSLFLLFSNSSDFLPLLLASSSCFFFFLLLLFLLLLLLLLAILVVVVSLVSVVAFLKGSPAQHDVL